MIALEEPHMVINSADFVGRYQMWNTWDRVPSLKAEPSARLEAGHIMKWCATVAKSAPGGRLKHLVFNCHGEPGALWIGRGFTLFNVRLFSTLKGLVDKIWLLACSSAQIEGPGTLSDGNVFVSEMARHANCHVVASTEKQIFRGQTYPYGKIDSFEGLVLSYSPQGQVTWSRRYSSQFLGE